MANASVKLPASIALFEAESAYLHPDLDFAYIDAVAADAVASVRAGLIPEINFQPGDGTRYGLVLVPLRLLDPARPRVVDGLTWGRHAISGMGDPYDRNGYLLSWVDHASYPFRLDAGHVSGSYLAEHFHTGETSGVTLAVLLRAISHHIGWKARWK